MCDFKYCTVCLITCVKMHSFNSRISSATIGEIFFKVMDFPVGIYNKYICFECASLLFKYEEFKSKCCRAQSILASFRVEDAKEIHKYIQTVDRKQKKLTSKLTSSSIENYDNQAPIIAGEESKVANIDNQARDAATPIIISESLAQVEDQVEDMAHIKSELIENDLDELVFEDGIDYETDIPIIKDKHIDTQNTKKKRKESSKFKRKPNKKAKTTEKESPSDDEPLAYKVTKTSEFKEVDIADRKEINIPEEKELSIEKPKVSKKVNDFNDFEDYVTVTFLTPDDAKKEVLLRRQSNNYINAPLKCELCYRGYEAKVAFENHMKKHSIEYGAYKCDVCQLRFPEQKYLCKHRLASHKRKFCCKICPYVCFCMHQAKTHVSLHKGKKYPCKECAEVFSMPNSLLMHKRQKHSTECVCEVCGQTFATPRGLYSHHMKLHRDHISEKLGPKCEECNTHFATEAAWKIHLVLSSKHNVSNGCKFCGEIFTTSEDLKCHMRVHTRKHASRDFKPGLCSMCEKWNEDLASFKLHLSSSHPQSEAAKKLLADSTPFVCEVCGRMFKKQCFLIYHQRKHSGERPYACVDCGNTFQLAGALASHRAVHRSAQAHKCQLCPRVFTFKSVLNKHMKVHLGIRPHQCGICEKSFISPCDVKVHVKYVHNKVPWPKRNRTKRAEPSFIQY